MSDLKIFGITIRRPDERRREYVFEFVRSDFTTPPDFRKSAEDQLRELAGLMGFEIVERHQKPDRREVNAYERLSGWPPMIAFRTDPLPLLQEFFTEKEAQKHIICPKTVALEQPRTCIGHTCGAWRWKREGTTCERGEPVGFCGVGGKP